MNEISGKSKYLKRNYSNYNEKYCRKLSREELSIFTL